MLEALRGAYLTIDRRVLGVFRVVFGCVLLYDLVYHATQATLFYSNSGILPNHRVLFAPQSPGQFSIYLPFSTPREIEIAFALTGVAYLGLLVGFRTRLCQIVAFLCVTSTNARNLFTEDGGCMTLNLLAAWTMFLPLGDRYSIDALLRDARGEPKRTEAPVTSLLVLGITLQIALIYLGNTVHKTGSTWRDGTAIHWVLWQDRLSTPIAAWLRMHEPSFLSPAFSRATLWIEGSMPLLVLAPRFQWPLRTLAVLFALGLHGGIALVMTLGPFSYAMMALVLLMLPPESLDWALARLGPSRLGDAARAVEARLREIVGRWVAPRPAPPRAPFFVEAGDFAREGFALLLLTISVFNALEVNPAVPEGWKLQQPTALETIRAYPRLIQFWGMFSPDVPTTDGILVIDATTASGAHIDPFNGKTPDLEMLGKGPFPYDVLVSDYLFKVGSFKNDLDRRELDRYLREWQETWHRPAGDRIVSYEAWLLTCAAPLPRTTAIRDAKRELAFSGTFAGGRLPLVDERASQKRARRNAAVPAGSAATTTDTVVSLAGPRLTTTTNAASATSDTAPSTLATTYLVRTPSTSPGWQLGLQARRSASPDFPESAK